MKMNDSAHFTLELFVNISGAFFSGISRFFYVSKATMGLLTRDDDLPVSHEYVFNQM